MVALLPRPLAPIDPAGWQDRAACRDALTQVDLTWEWDETYPEDLAGARALCRSCPVLQQCRAVALAVTDYAGMAGGMTEGERAAYRQRRGIVVQVVAVLELLPGREFAPEWADLGAGLRLPEEFIREVARMSADGLTKRDIADLLAGTVPGLQVTVATVKHARALHAGSRTRVSS